MFDEASDTPAYVANTDLNSDLGQIEYLFCDKNGTLTENKMEFRMCSIRGRIFGKKKDQGIPCELFENYKDFCFYDKSLVEEAKSNKDIQDFLEILALCHTSITEHD